ncbi:uncharacterized protein LOC34618942 [Cyclospora cayetanensis]|uniref:Uncharacterized protein LOC34618942 n=2 Tax=Cyclospora cayetanensis TaxID=88456 RepID=A0A6P5WDE6_9EIME|nr:uncharacterized protein LOC34618942 [Cyclospora cayetanensis]OEH75478.1 hypothetical protein cyc_02032 [Cyclospora cayetanensis]
MKLIETALVATALVASYSFPSEALKVGGIPQQHLQPAAAFAEVQAQEQALQQIRDAIAKISSSSSDDPEDADGESTMQRQLLVAITPAMRTLMRSLAMSIAPQLKDECDKIVADLTAAAGGDLDEDLGLGDFSFQQQQQRQKVTAQSFWDTVKKNLGKVATLAAPLVASLAEKLGPMVEKLGKKAAPVFATHIASLMHEACLIAEQEAGVEPVEAV